MMKLKLRYKSLLSLLVVATALGLSGVAQASTYDDARLIDNSIFLNAATMTQADIQAFLNSKGGALARQTFATNSNGNQSAAWIIYYTAQHVGINPQAIMATLQKEESLITDPSPSQIQYDAAMGYACPDSGSCTDPGFFAQVLDGSWQLRFNYERANGNAGYWQAPDGTQWGNPSIRYACGTTTRFYSPGLYPNTNVTFYNGSGVAYSSINIANAATAALYCYTPHVHSQYYTGSYNFVVNFNNWFGSTLSGICIGTNNSTIKTDINFGKVNSKADQGIFNILSGTGSACVEAHIWNPGLGSWQTHIASNMPSIAPPDSFVTYADLDGSGRDEPILVGLRGTGSGKVEFHVWNPDMKTWQTHIASNQPAVDPATTTVEFGDVDGDGKDEAVLIGFKGTSTGRIEFHVWNAGMQTWREHEASNSAQIDPAVSEIRFADVDGSGHDVPVLIGLKSTGSGMVEFHVWNPHMQSWQEHQASNSLAVDPASSAIEFADFDGSGKDVPVLIGLRGTGSGMVEFHVWNPHMQSWRAHIASNQMGL